MRFPQPRSTIVAAPAAAAKIPLVTFGLLATLIAVFAAQLSLAVVPYGSGYALPPLDLTIAGGALSSLVIANGQWFRLVAAIFLHASLLHLVGNGIVLLFAGWMLERSVGRRWLLAIFLLGGVGGSLVSVLANAAQDPVSVGASGAIMALLAVLFALTFHATPGMSRISKQASLARLLIPALFPALRTGSGFTIDAADHAGGAITGAVIGIILLTVWKSNQAAPGHRRAAGAAALACVLLLGVGLWQGIGTGFALAGDYAETAQQWDRALDDARLAVELNPRDSENYNVRGEAEFALGRFLSAAADYETSGQLTPSWEYWHILASLARVHAGADFATEFRTQAPPPAGAAWPGPVIAFYHGKISLAELLAAANARPPYDSETPAQKNCEAAFYLGEYETLHKQAAAAESLFGQAIASCPQDYLEYQLAAAERARL